jgi:hypothetical protein
MNVHSSRLSVTPVGRAVAQSILHPRSADQLVGFTAHRIDDLLALAASEADEKTFNYTLLHVVYSSYEYGIQGSNRVLPYQLKHLAENTLADAANEYLIERPWHRNPTAANAAMMATRWIEGQPRNKLAPEFPVIGSGVSQAMTSEGAEILFAWSDCLIAATLTSTVESRK